MKGLSVPLSPSTVMNALARRWVIALGYDDISTTILTFSPASAATLQLAVDDDTSLRVRGTPMG